MDVRILGISGSLRQRSYNTALLREAGRLAPEGVTVDLADLAGIPLYNGDTEAASGYPAAVEGLRESIRSADAILISTPEYNFSVTGVLKNALDWASRGSDSPLNEKIAAVMGAGGRFGTARAQLHLREILMHNRVLVLPRELLVSRAWEQFDQEFHLTDPALAQRLTRHVEELASLAERLRPAVV